MISEKIVPVILSGGTGTRLWPMSREDHPKQFYGLRDPDMSLMQETITRVSDPIRFHPPVIVGNHAHRFLIADQLRRSGIASPSIIVEPCVRNTAPAIATAALHVRERYQDALMLVLPTDQLISDKEKFLSGIEQAAQAARGGSLITFGIKPGYAETGYGYIRKGNKMEAGDVFSVTAFVEKPDAATAEQYIATGEHFWNSGMFLFPASLLMEEIDVWQPLVGESCRHALSRAVVDSDFMRLDEVHFSKAPMISIDYAVMERTRRAAMVPLDCGWSDTGAWESMWRISPHDDHGNTTIGDAYLMDSRNCYARSENGPFVAAYGVENLVVVATKDAVLVAHRDHTHKLKDLVERIRGHHPQLVAQNSHTYRPWGMYENIKLGQRYQVKRLSVKPGAKLSLQMHYHRAEHWIVVSGTALVTCDGKETMLTENQSFYIPHGSVHRIENPGKVGLEIIEVQSGAYLGEDDIVRFEDQYGRISQVAA